MFLPGQDLLYAADQSPLTFKHDLFLLSCSMQMINLQAVFLLFLVYDVNKNVENQALLP
jgi:hypothetical protein